MNDIYLIGALSIAGLFVISIIGGIWDAAVQTGEKPSLKRGLPYGWWKPRLITLLPFLIPLSLIAGAGIAAMVASAF